MKYNFNITLNEIGVKAFNKTNKTIVIDCENDNLQNESIETLEKILSQNFAIELVEHFEVEKSFINLKKDDCVKVIFDSGESCLGYVLSIYSNYINIKFNYYDGNERYLTFNTKGVEATHSNKKAKIAFLNDDEVKQMKKRYNPFRYLLGELSKGGHGYTINITDEDNLQFPEYFNEETIKEINMIIDEAKCQYFNDIIY